MARLHTLVVRAAAALSIAALAVPDGAAAQARVIGPGQEQAVLALFEPHGLGDEVGGGFALWNVSIEPQRIDVTLHAEDGRETRLSLQHPDRAPDGATRSESFGIAVVEGGASGPDAEAARRALIEVVQRNDHGGFWSASTVTVAGRGGVDVVGGMPSFTWGSSTWVPLDGLTVIALVFALALLLAGRLLASEPRWMAWALAGVVVAGGLVRLALAPATFLGAWPWSRVYPNVRAVVEGDWIRVVADHVGHPLAFTDVAMWTNYAYAVAMPLVLFAHATYLMRDARIGLAAAFALAFLPQHIRFSRSEDGFVASLVLTSLAFAVIHGFLRDRSRAVRWLLLLALPFVLYPGYLLRPLNILFVVVYVAAIIALHEGTAPRWRRGLALSVVLGVGASAAYQFVVEHPGPIEAATSRLDWLFNVAHVLVSPRLLVLTDPTRTPPLLIVLAVAGGVLAWRAGERRLVLFLVGWLLLFVVTHAFVVQESMQPRYHLHLVVPFLLLAASVVPRVPEHRRRWLWAGAAVLAVSPWLHVGFIRDTGYTEPQEYAFVRSARDVVPDGCTVLEYAAPDGALDGLRFERIGALVGGDRETRYRSIAVLPGVRTEGDDPSLDALLSDPPACLYFFEGLACTSLAAAGEPHAADCDALRERLDAETVLRASAPVRFYDDSNAPRDVERRTGATFRLSRARLAR